MNHEEVYSSPEREKMISEAQKVSDAFYQAARNTGFHAFLEFCGLMNEFLVVCREAQKNRQDFTQANTHTGQSLPFEPHNAAYIAEKLNCIYGPTLLANHAARAEFIRMLFDGKYKLVPVRDATP